MGRRKEAQDVDPGPLPEADEEMTVAQVWAGVEPGAKMSGGIYSIYKTVEGGMHIAYRPDGTEEDQHLPLPAPMVAMMFAAAEGKGRLGRLKAMAAGRLG